MNAFPEAFLHFIWNGRHWHPRKLHTREGLPVTVHKTGKWNHDQGPDFLEALIEIDSIKWHGHVEIHRNSREWFDHQHHRDPGYNNTILHVVHESSESVPLREDGTRIPEVVLKESIPERLWEQYEDLMLSQKKIPCQSHWPSVKKTIALDAVESRGKERILRKMEGMRRKLAQTQHHWSQILWEEISCLMGGPVNGELFGILSRRVPFGLVSLYQDDRTKVEALLFGGVGMLEGRTKDDWQKKLKEEWIFLQNKHRIPPHHPLPLKFLRMRPAAFPTIRLSQLASLIANSHDLLSLLSRSGIESFLDQEITASDYWSNHIRFGEAGSERKKKLGSQQKRVLICNVFVPLGMYYLQTHGGDSDLLLEVLHSLPSENNRITRMFDPNLFPSRHILHSQGKVELYKSYCTTRKCLQCSIGQSILEPGEN